MKKSLVLFTIICLILTIQPNLADANSNIKIQINGEVQSFSGMAMNGRTLVPLRGIFEKLEAEVEWKSDVQQVIAANEYMFINLRIGSKVARISNGEHEIPVVLDQPAIISKGSTMVPLRFISEALGAQVLWDSPTKTVSITYNDELGEKAADRITELAATAPDYTNPAELKKFMENNYNSAKTSVKTYSLSNYKVEQKDGKILIKADFSDVRSYKNNFNKNVPDLKVWCEEVGMTLNLLLPDESISFTVNDGSNVLMKIDVGFMIFYEIRP
ncbi:copper amine oxidase N-terminal domain-containing protein [Caldalkalibacillus mannanilyticus]|uniref:copper amine oxidase N-terminal domain-containing protein n=1 Tax=Caldalkalibacillus mannanilyticus TaxID=1418 RepID=UPI0004696D20|nr:stalk domain-containing protein [Caldalkalibacillus mannanilyticus]